MSVTDKKYSYALGPGQSLVGWGSPRGPSKGPLAGARGGASHCIPALHSRIAFLHYIPALHSCITFPHCIPALEREAKPCKKNDPEWIRTTDRRIRNPVLYPAELRDHARCTCALGTGSTH